MSLITAYRQALTHAAATFRSYAENHRAKIGVKFEEGTPGAADTIAKSMANDDHAAFMEAVLEYPAPEPDHQIMVATLQKHGDAILAQITPLKIMCLHMAGGAASEGGELFDAIKRWALFGKDLDRENVIEELGDLEFFMEGLRQNLGIDRDETLHHNIFKLTKGTNPRYPGGVFSDAATIARADKHPGVDRELSDEEALRIADDKHACQMADLETDPIVLGDPRIHSDDADRCPIAAQIEGEPLPGASEGLA